MMEEPVIIRMNIAHCRAMLKLDMDGEKHSIVKRLLADAKRDLVLAVDRHHPRGVERVLRLGNFQRRFGGNSCRNINVTSLMRTSGLCGLRILAPAMTTATRTVTL